MTAVKSPTYSRPPPPQRLNIDRCILSSPCCSLPFVFFRHQLEVEWKISKSLLILTGGSIVQKLAKQEENKRNTLHIFPCEAFSLGGLVESFVMFVFVEGLRIFVFDTVMFYSYQTSQWPRLTNKARESFKWLNPYGSCGFYVAKIDVMGLKNVDETRKGSRYKEANHPQCTPSATRPFSTWLSINL